MLIREGKAVARSVPMQHAFNFPHQLARGNWEDADVSELESPKCCEVFGGWVMPASC